MARTLIDRTADAHGKNNSSLASLGSDLLGYYTSEHLLCKYPRLPITVLFAAQYAYVGPRALAAISREWGIEAATSPGPDVDPGLLQFKRLPPNHLPYAMRHTNDRDQHVQHEQSSQSKIPNEARIHWRRSISSRVIYEDQFGELRPELVTPTGESQTSSSISSMTSLEDASKNCVRAVLATIYLYGGRTSCKQFYSSHFLSRQLDIASLFDFRQPARDLSRLCAREGFEPPVARLISEAGRHSHHPVFIVGVYSGSDKLGEGVGSSIDEASFKASASAVRGWYLYSPHTFATPSSHTGDLTNGESKVWQPAQIDIGEIIS